MSNVITEQTAETKNAYRLADLMAMNVTTDAKMT